MITTNICIIGAGPAGATAALHLAGQGISCTLIDKARFPRDKVCGDALSGKVVSMLNILDPDWVEELDLTSTGVGSWGITLTSPNHKVLRLDYLKPNGTHPPGFVVPRFDFDNFLIEKVRKNSRIHFIEEVSLEKFERNGDQLILCDPACNFKIQTKLVIAANGAYSSFSRHWAGLPMEPKHYGAGVRAYFEGVSGFDDQGLVELHFYKEFLPGYLWVFPLPDNGANVGLYIRSDVVSKKKIDLKKSMLEKLEQVPELSSRFSKARMVSKIEGFGLPLGSKTRRLSGDNYLLAGDAAHLIDPFTGEGIGNAMLSGYLAAKQACEAVGKGIYSAESLKKYEEELSSKLKKELSISKWVQTLAHYPKLLNFVVNVASKEPSIQKLMSSMLDDLDSRSRLKDPMTYLKLLVRKWQYL